MHEARLIIVTGLPGTGKSTVARQLAARYGLPVVGKDAIKEPLLDVLGAADRAQSRRLSNASFAVLFAMTRELLSAGVDLILEGNFRPGEHERMLQAALPARLLEQASERMAQVLCRLDERERRSRLAARAGDPTRHAGHRDQELAVEPSPTGNDFLDLPGARYVIDTTEGSPDGGDGLTALDRWWRGHGGNCVPDHERRTSV